MSLMSSFVTIMVSAAVKAKEILFIEIKLIKIYVDILAGHKACDFQIFSFYFLFAYGRSKGDKIRNLLAMCH